MSENKSITSRNMELEYSIDNGIGYRTHLGFIILANDQTLPYELHRLLDIPGVAIYESKQVIPVNPNALLTKEVLESQKDYITNAARIINARREPDVVAYGCTSGAMTLGSDVVAGKINEVLPNAIVTNPLVASIEAFHTLRVRKVAFLSPYIPDVNNGVIRKFQEHGIEVPLAGRFYKEGSNPSKDAPWITPESIEKAILIAGKDDDIEGVFISCTQMRFVDNIEETEKKLGKPIVTSNTALCWHALRLSGCIDIVNGFGKLLKF